MSLLAFQQEFCERLLDDTAPDEALFGTRADVGLGIYRNAYRARLMECLRTAFGHTWSWIGDDAFETAARQHIILNPPSSWTLDDYGADFDATLKMLFPGDPEVAELAWLERAVQTAFSADDDVSVSVEVAQAHVASSADWDRMQLGFVPSLTTRTIRTNAPDIWQALADAQTPPSASLRPDGNALRVWRKGFTPRFRVIEPDEVEAIAAIRAGERFGEICARLARQWGDEAAVARAGSMFGSWLADGMIAHLD